MGGSWPGELRCAVLRRAAYLCLSVLCALPASAQEVRGAPGEAPAPGPGWTARESNLDYPAYPFMPEEQAAVVARLEAIESIFRRVPVLAQPDGFELGGLLAWGNERPTATRETLFSYQYRLHFWQGVREYDPDATIIVVVNPYPQFLALDRGEGRDSEEWDGAIFDEPPRGDSVPGALVYDGLMPPYASIVQVVFLAGEELPFAHVSRERYLRSLLPVFEKSDAELAAATAVSPLDRWLSEAASRREIREGAIAGLVAQGLVAEAENYRVENERAEAETEALLRAQANSGAAAFFQLAAQTPPMAPQFRARLESMAPEERKIQACTDPAGEPYALVSPETPGARCMVAGNPAFYRTVNSPVAARAIVVYMQYNGGDLGNPSFMDQTIYDVFETLDWDALRRLVQAD